MKVGRGGGEGGLGKTEAHLSLRKNNKLRCLHINLIYLAIGELTLVVLGSVFHYIFFVPPFPQENFGRETI